MHASCSKVESIAVFRPISLICKIPAGRQWLQQHTDCLANFRKCYNFSNAMTLDINNSDKL